MKCGRSPVGDVWRRGGSCLFPLRKRFSRADELGSRLVLAVFAWWVRTVSGRLPEDVSIVRNEGMIMASIRCLDTSDNVRASLQANSLPDNRTRHIFARINTILAEEDFDWDRAVDAVFGSEMLDHIW